jgi:hypothetical protein
MPIAGIKSMCIDYPQGDIKAFMETNFECIHLKWGIRESSET